ncbi:C6 transcriptional factoral factor [Mycena indigotica]|uniref:C6 transcriptional factoral factor n=1 Tax=Mycena indigotica TaxID=2126181 RepID=A0A8H6T491_9AGAR|nr:C6 transcriptional factoral factor [Mycena indigotica]KAF7309956.1 C6 transcriptional factoral factor [Mycena indigotica]
MQPERPLGPQLPSIRTLHPYLPPPSTIVDPPSTSQTALSQTLAVSEVDSDELDDGQEREREREREQDTTEEPPKKKRRRQALSCTECKRRKIRCDRKQPCGPCARRGEQEKCQWNLVEPATEKYVPRAEHDALRARVDALEAYLQRIPPSALVSLPPIPSGPPLLLHRVPTPAPAMSPLATASGLPTLTQSQRLAPYSSPSAVQLSGPGYPPYVPGQIENLRPIYPRSRSGASSPSDLRRLASSPLDIRRQEQQQQPSRSSSRRGPPQPAYTAFPPPPPLSRPEQSLTTTEPLGSWFTNQPDVGSTTNSSRDFSGQTRASGESSGGRASGSEPGDTTESELHHSTYSHNSSPSTFAARFPAVACILTESDLEVMDADIESTPELQFGDADVQVLVASPVALRRSKRFWPSSKVVFVDSIVRIVSPETTISSNLLACRKPILNQFRQQSTVSPCLSAPDMPIMVIVCFFDGQGLHLFSVQVQVSAIISCI